MQILLTTLLTTFLLLQNLYSGTIKVPQDVQTIQSAIDSSLNGDTVLVSSGTYLENINFNGKNIVLGSLLLTTGDTSYISQTIIDGNQQGCVVVFESGEDSTAVLTGFTITNGYSFQDSLRGGGITCINSSNPKLNNLKIINNEVVGDSKMYGGGGIYCLRQSSPQMENLYIENNNAKYSYGGGIYCKDSSNSSMTNTIVNNNNSSYGGGISLVNSRLTLTDLQIMSNKSREGGGIYLNNSAIEIHNSIMNENIARHSYGSRGGGIFAYSSDVFIKNTDISNNSVEAPKEPNSQGGGISVASCALIIQNCTINENLSQGGGGGISIKGSNTKIYTTSISNNLSIGKQYGGGINASYTSSVDTLYMEDVLIVDNYSEGYGGGIAYYPKNLTEGFHNVVIKNNTAGKNGGGLYTNSNLIISEESDCSIFLNRAKNVGSDIYMWGIDSTSISSIYLDTVTVSKPADYQIYPKQNIDFHFKNAIFNSVDSDLYVSPTGSNSNSGISQDEPLKTIDFALMVASADSNNCRIINLASGIYSPSTNGEKFPLIGRSYIAIKGERVDTTILDGENENNLIELFNCNRVYLTNFTIQNGYGWNGGGINLSGIDILLKNLIIKDNLAEKNGGAVYISNSNQVDLVNLTISNNTSNEPNSGGGISFFNPELNEKKDISIINCIVHSNTPINIKLNSLSLDTTDTVLIGYSNIEDGEQGITNNNVVIHWQEGNIDADPLFIGGEPFDYHLSDSSPCINTGTPFFVWEGDTLINLSPEEYIGKAPDMGALESDVLISVERKDKLPTEIKLEQNYPNPFNPSTTLSYSLPTSSNVKLEIYDVMGRMIKSFTNNSQSSGTHQVFWNGTNSNGTRVATGIYIYRFEATSLETHEHFVKTEKLMLVK